MSLSTGARLGPYEVIAPLGAGGMGEVYRARDTKLAREVALKVLPDLFVADAERVARFEREAKTLASLNHPNIAAIYGLADGALVMELVEGPTLAERIAQGPIPVDDALAIARQIAEALEAAHEHGIIHRDLKPANIKLRPDGAVKVLDFGLAKTLGGTETASSSAPALLSLSPTMASPGVSAVGSVVGTAAYMAPEQAKGRGADKGSDVWAFGCVLYEMLTGRRAFEGEDLSDTLAAVLRGEPDWAQLPPAAPPALIRLLRRMLERDRRRRIADVAVVAYVLEELRTGADAGTAPVRRRLHVMLAAAAAVVVAAVAGSVVAWNAAPSPPAPVVRFDVTPAQETPLSVGPAGANMAISPDSTKLVYHIVQVGTSVLELRRLDRGESQSLPSTEAAVHPAFSPDSSTIAFVRDGKLHALPLDAKGAVTVCDVQNVFGVSWAQADTIVYAQTGQNGGLYRVRSTGGRPEAFAVPDRKAGEQEYVDPEMLPDGSAVLFTVIPRTAAQVRLTVRSLRTGEQKTLIEGASSARYLSTGHIAYVQGGALMVSGFDASALALTGAAIQVLDGLATKGNITSNFSVSRNGALAYIPGSAITYVSQFIWMDRNGRSSTPAVPEMLDYPRYPRLAGDGRRLAATLGPANGGNIWVYDLGGATQALKLTFTAHNIRPMWSPDGRRIAFESTRDGLARNLFVLPSDASVSEAERIVANERNKGARAWSPDGSVLMYMESGDETRTDLWLYDFAQKKSGPWLQTPFNEDEPSFSPDGRWVAYVTDQTGQSEVWVRPFPGPGAPVRVSNAGGHDPVWARNGKELFYQEGVKLMSAEVSAMAPALQLRAPRLLFAGGFISWQPNAPGTYDVAADGRFLMIAPSSAESQRVNVVLNWAVEVARRSAEN